MTSANFMRLVAVRTSVELDSQLLDMPFSVLRWSVVTKPPVPHRYWLPLVRLWGTQSMVRLDRFVEPPLD